MSFDLILPYLRPIENLLFDPEVSEIIIHGFGRVSYEKGGVLFRVEDLVLSEDYRQAALQNIASLVFNQIDETKPLLDGRLPDGSRVSGVLFPIAVDGTIINIRKFRPGGFTAAQLVANGMLTASMLAYLIECVEEKKSILISGQTTSGKTTLLNALTAFFPANDHVLLVEDTAEMNVKSGLLDRMEVRREQPRRPEVSMRDLLKQVLRMRPDRIVVGEVRGPEAFDLMVVGNTGHDGIMTTAHANSAIDAATRLRTLIAMADAKISDLAAARMVPEVFQVLVHVKKRRDGQRYVSEILRLGKYSAASDSYECQEIIEEKVCRIAAS